MTAGTETAAPRVEETVERLAQWLYRRDQAHYMRAGWAIENGNMKDTYREHARAALEAAHVDVMPALELPELRARLRALADEIVRLDARGGRGTIEAVDYDPEVWPSDEAVRIAVLVQAAA